MKTGIISVLVCLVVLGASIGFLQWRSQDADTRIMNETETAADTDQSVAIQDEEATLQSEAVETSTEDTLTAQSSFPVSTDNGALVIGEEDAPVTITEFSSLSCSHCASFHNNTLPSLKKDYVDSGMVKIIFRDFPTNQPAMDASKLLKCVDVNDRYDFMNLLFEQQIQWAAPSVNHRQKLQQYAAFVGISNDQATNCMNDKAVENEIITNLQQANKQYGVSSTPTFVINPGEEILIGARPYGDFSTRIEAIANQGE